MEEKRMDIQSRRWGQRVAFYLVSSVFYTMIIPGFLFAAGSIKGWGHQVVGGDLSKGFTSVAAGEWHSLALKSDGCILVWGDNSYGQATPPEGNDFVAIAAGVYHSLALKSDGSIVGWGSNGSGQATPPSGNNFVAVAAGGSHSLALTSDNTIVARGNNSSGQCNVPEPNTGFIAVAAGNYHSLGLKGDGSIVAWGSNDYGKCDVPEPNTGFIAIVAGGTCSSAIVQTCDYALAGDLNDDCRVDFYDFATMASNWLIDCTAEAGNPQCVHK